MKQTFAFCLKLSACLIDFNQHKVGYKLSAWGYSLPI